jgi:hypothetical protein
MGILEARAVRGTCLGRELLSALNNSPEHTVVTDLERWKKSMNILCGKVQICHIDNSTTFIQDIMTEWDENYSDISSGTACDTDHSRSGQNPRFRAPFGQCYTG